MLDALITFADTIGLWLSKLPDNVRKLKGKSESEEATLLEVTKEDVKKGKK